MSQLSNCSVRPALEAMEGRQLLSATLNGHPVPQPAAETSHAVPLTGVESGADPVRIERTSPLQEHFRFRGQGAIDDQGPVRVTGEVTLKEAPSRAGTATGVIRLTLHGLGTARGQLSQAIPAHTGSSGSTPFLFTFSGGTGVFRHRFDNGSGTLTPTTATPAMGGSKEDFTMQLFSDEATGLIAAGQLHRTAAAPSGTARHTATPAPSANPLGFWYWTFQQCCG